MQWYAPFIDDTVRQAHAQASDAFCAYVYDMDALQKHAAALVSSLPQNCELFYAVKANPDQPILRTLAPIVAGFEVASSGELSWVREHCPESPVIFGGPGKTDGELSSAAEAGIDCLHVESFGELQRLAWIARESGRQPAVLLRMNMALAGVSATSLTMGGRATPFGIDASQLGTCLRWLQQHSELRLRGFHFHLLSHQLDAQAHLDLLEQYFAQVKHWQREYGIAVDLLNVGGGIGINYRQPERQFDWQIFHRGLAALIQRMGMGSHRIRFELGRYLTAACGYYAMEVLDIKDNLGQTFVVGRGGTHHFRTPAAQGHSHPFRVLPVAHWPYPFSRPTADNCRINVVGQLCTPKDVLATDVAVARVQAGDLLVFPLAGAYAWHISHQDFLRHPPPLHLYLPAKWS